MRASVRGVELFFDVDGAALVPDGSGMRVRPTIILVHGGPGTDHTAWKRRYAGLERAYQLVYFDQRGHGRSSSADPSSYTLEENVEDLEALRKYLGLQKVVTLGGSYGGMVAMAHAARYPQAVSHLILACTAAHSGYFARAKEIVELRGTREQVEMFGAMLGGKLDDQEKIAKYFAVMGSLYSNSAPKDGDPPQEEIAFGVEAFNNAYRPGGFLRSFDLRPELERIDAKTLILAGRHDWICPPEFSEELNLIIPGSALQIFERSGHSLGVDARDEFIRAVSNFLAN